MSYKAKLKNDNKSVEETARTYGEMLKEDEVPVGAPIYINEKRYPGKLPKPNYVWDGKAFRAPRQ